jgi:hypothetical protein
LALRIAPRAPRMARVLPAWPGAVREHAHLRVRAHTHTHTHTHTQPHTATHTHTHTHSHTHTATHTHTHTHTRARTHTYVNSRAGSFFCGGWPRARPVSACRLRAYQNPAARAVWRGAACPCMRRRRRGRIPCYGRRGACCVRAGVFL